METISTVSATTAPNKPKKEPPRVSGGLPLIGHTVAFIRDTIGLLERAHRECGNVARFDVVGKSMYLLTGPAAQEPFFRAADEVLSPKEAYKMMVPVFGKGVAYDNEPGKMMEQLHMLLPALQDKRMRSYGEIIAAETHQSLEKWGDEGTVDIYEWSQQLTSYTSSHCLLGKEFRGELSDEFARVYHDLERGIVPIGYIHPYLPIPAFRRRDAARARLGEMVADIVNRRRKSGHVGEDFLQTLMEAKYKDGGSLSDHEITGMLVAAMFAGHHTSSVTTAWTILELLQHPHELAKVKTELDGVFGDGTPVSFQALREINRTEWAVKEALRLHPPLFILLRAVLEDFEVLGYKIPKGAWVVTSPLVAHHESSEFADAMKFDPERYGPGRAEDRKPFTYISFGAGRHKCMGNAFALLQIKTIMAILLQTYELELVGDEVIGDFQGLVIGPRQPCRVRYRRRR